MSRKKIRLDTLVVERALFQSREKAKRAILAGEIKVNDVVMTKPGHEIDSEALIDVSPKKRFVSRGGEKLAGALKEYAVDLAGLVAADIGASTGGFTDCLLQNGVKKVYAVDVGYGQLDWSLRSDERVVVYERMNARYLSKDDLPELVDIATIDASFISLKKIIPAVLSVLKPGGKIFALIKPQFEAGRRDVDKGGVVKNDDVRQKVVEEIKNYAIQLDLIVEKTTMSVLKGPKGNIEYFIFLSKP